MRDLEQTLLSRYPLAVWLLERCVRPTTGGAVEREEQCCLGDIVIRVIIIVIAGRPIWHGRAVLHHGRHRTSCCCTGAITGVAVAVVTANGSRGADGGADRRGR